MNTTTNTETESAWDFDALEGVATLDDGDPRVTVRIPSETIRQLMALKAAEFSLDAEVL